MIPELEAIKHLFLHQWDPIGIAEIPEAHDEYDAYAMRVFTSLYEGATVQSVAEYLEWVESEHMGLTTVSGRSRKIAAEVVSPHEQGSILTARQTGSDGA